MHQAHPEFENSSTDIALRGLTLTERMRLASGRLKSVKTENHGQNERLKSWRSWFERSNATKGWRDFLADNSLTEKQLLVLDNIPRTNRGLPTWTTTLERICRFLENAKLEPSDRLSVGENLAAALVGFAWDEFSRRANSRLLAGKAALALRQSLLRRLVWTAGQAVDWEISAANAAQRVSRSLKPERDFQRYFFSSGVAAEVLRLMQNYPALARLWSIQIDYWSRYMRQFLEDAALFARRRRVRIAKDETLISSIDIDLSDLHERNRSVLGVTFADGQKWFYKPRTGRQERAWFELLDWINGHGFRPSFRILEVKCQDRHCWMEGVPARRCRNEREARLFWFRTGALTCLIHLLRGVDFHPENLIMAGSHPVVVDCETLLHAAIALPEYARAEDDSIRRTGMLILIKQISNGMFGRQRKVDQMLNDLTGGFTALHQFMRRPSVIRYLRRWVARLRMSPARIVYRPTAHYRGMFSQSLAPSLLANGLERSLYLHASSQDGIIPSRLAVAEVAALQNADIPVFRRKPRRIKLDLSEKTLRQSLIAIRAASANTEGLTVND